MLGTILSAASAVSGLLGSKKPTSSTESTMPVIMPRAEPFYKQLETDFIPKVYNKPYESPFLMRYEPTNQYEQSPILDMIQRSIDAQQTQQEVQAPAPRQPEPQTMQAMIDAALGRQLYEQISRGEIPSSRSLQQGYAGNLSWNSTPEDFATMYRLWNDPEERGFAYRNPPGGPSRIEGIDRSKLTSEAAIDYYDRIKSATGV